eukprot:1161050-Pelagomonas_calceolata.AAC.1
MSALMHYCPCYSKHPFSYSVHQGSSRRPGTGKLIKDLACAGGAGQSWSGETGSFYGSGPAGPETIIKCLRCILKT